MLTLTTEQLLEQLRLQMAQLDLKIRLAHSTERITDLNILQDQKQALIKELAAAEEDTANLTITAPGDGVCISGNLTNLSGTYLGKGQELMWIVSARQKQLTGAAAQNDIDDFRQFSGKTVDVDMRTAGMGIFQARLNRISPTATAAPPVLFVRSILSSLFCSLTEAAVKLRDVLWLMTRNMTLIFLPICCAFLM